MSDSISNEKDLGNALKQEKEQIIIEGNLKDKVIKIKATGLVAWAVAIGSIGIAVVAVIMTAGSGGTASPTTAPLFIISGGAAATILGAPTAISAVLIGVAAGGVGALNKLRKYEITYKDKDKIILKKK